MNNAIWAPWRMEYINSTDKKEKGCIFCNRFKLHTEKDILDNYILDKNKDVMVILNKYPYTNGHLMVVPNKHISRPFDLNKSEYTQLMLVLNKSIQLIQEAFSPDGINVGMNLGAAAGAGIQDHIHFHIVPRWIGDNNFMPVIGNVRVMPEYLEATYNKLKPFFKDVCSL